MYWWIGYIAVAVAGVAIGLLLRRGVVSEDQLEAVKEELMKIPRDALPEDARLVLEGVIIALMMWTGEIGRREGEEKLMKVNMELLRRGLKPLRIPL